MIESLIIKRVSRSPGKAKVAGMLVSTLPIPFLIRLLVCGSSGFSDAIRDIVLRTMNVYEDVEFVETEFQPQGVRQGYPGIDRRDIDDDEMAVVKKGQKKHLVKSSRLAGVSAATEKSPPGNKSGINDDEEGLVKTHSGVASRLHTLHEEDFQDNIGRKVDIKEIV